jgi:hypothetical protein
MGCGCLMHSTQRLRLGVSSHEVERMRLRHQRCEQAWDVLMRLCAAAGSAWLLQFIEDMQQSRAFHETCELKLPNEAATIPEVLLFLPPYPSPLLIVTLPAAVNATSQQRDYTV